MNYAYGRLETAEVIKRASDENGLLCQQGRLKR